MPPPGSALSPGLSPTQAETLLEIVASLAGDGADLSELLQTAAKDTRDRKVQTALDALAAALHQGQRIDEALGRLSPSFPRSCQGLVTIAATTGELASTLPRLIQWRAEWTERRRGILATLAYPAAMLGLAVCAFVIQNLLVLRPLVALVQELNVVMPPALALVAWWSHQGVWLILATLIVAAVGLLCLRLLASLETRERLLHTLPLVGELWRWSAVTEWAFLLGVLTEYRVPLPRALRLVESAAGSPMMSEGSRRLAELVERGEPLAAALSAVPVFPGVSVPLVRWGETHEQLAEALEELASHGEHRLSLREQLVRLIAPPAMFFAILLVMSYFLWSIYSLVALLVRGIV